MKTMLSLLFWHVERDHRNICHLNQNFCQKQNVNITFCAFASLPICSCRAGFWPLEIGRFPAFWGSDCCNMKCRPTPYHYPATAPLHKIQNTKYKIQNTKYKFQANVSAAVLFRLNVHWTLSSRTTCSENLERKRKKVKIGRLVALNCFHS